MRLKMTVISAEYLKNGRTDGHDEDRFGRSAIGSYETNTKFEKALLEGRHSEPGVNSTTQAYD